MAGFGQAKALEGASAPMQQQASTNDPLKDIRAEMSDVNSNKPKTHIFMAVVGKENTGKSAIIFDYYQKYCNDFVAHPNNDGMEPKKFWVIDFDSGGSATKSAYYSENENIKCWEPWVYMEGGRSAYNYPDTHDRVINIMKVALEETDNLWGVLISGIDQWDAVATNCMRIADLGLSKDGIEAADNRGAGDNTRVQSQWDWAVRVARFHQLTAMCRALVKRGTRVFWETHMKDVYKDGKVSKTDGAPAWEKSSAGYMYQIVHCRREVTTDDEGEMTGEKYTATFTKSKTDSTLQGQSMTTLVTQHGKPPKFMGLPELERLE